ncbi:MAG: hypothetical protein H6661_10515 [Ardenticatenaceae bacterium]|nr:hypothetical protein [Ardenticatenaceae bacterium]
MPFSDMFAAFRWWVVLLVLGTAVFPLAAHFLKPLPDRGYAFSKMLGLLLVTFLFWLLGSLGFLQNDLGGILLALALVIGLSAWAVYRERMKGGTAVLPWLRENWRQVLITELVFAVMFALWVWVRAQNPAITATEKPMEFAFLNSAGRSAAMPPLDPWLSGYAISYYYFGYVMTSVLARLAAVPEAIAFNLAIAWLVAGTAVGAFGLVYNLIALRGARASARLFGVIAAVALPIAGNQQITLEVLYANEVGPESFWGWLDVRDINTAYVPDQTPRYETSGWWWWRSSRPIHEYHLSGRAEEGLEPIAEFPGFSFVLGDMHPHVLALPFAFLSLAVALAWWAQASGRKGETGDWGRETESPPSISNLQSLVSSLQSYIPDPAFFLFTALVVGGLSFLNTWDVFIHLFVVAGAFALGRWRAEGWSWRVVGQGAVLGGLLLVTAVLLYLPFYLGFKSQAGPPFLLPMLMQATRLPQFLVIFAMPLWAITIWLAALAVRQRFRYWQKGVGTAVALLAVLFFLTFFFSWLVASSADGAGRVSSLAAELGLTLAPRPESGVALGWGLTAVFAILPTYLANRLTHPAMILYLAALIALVVMLWHNHLSQSQPDAQQPPDHTPTPSHPHTPTSSPLPFVLLLVLTGALLTLGPEFVYLRDNFGQRLNTIFKFYYQAWVLFGVAALFGLDYLLRDWREGAQRLVAYTAVAGYALMLAFALLFPIYGVRSRMIEYRGPADLPDRPSATLNGLAYVERYNPDEYAAIQWLRNNVDGSPVIVEAVGGQYTGYGRIAANTGLPTLLGWGGHEYQWRGPDTPEPGLREPAVQNIYTLSDWAATAALLDQYHVDYIYVGGLERDTYGPQAQEKFADRLEVAYQNGSVTIYRWQ